MRVGVIIPGGDLTPRWVHLLMERLQNHAMAELAVVIQEERPKPSRAPVGSWLWSAYRQVDRSYVLGRFGETDWNGWVPIGTLNLPRLRTTPEPDGSGWRYPPAIVDALHRLTLDLLLRACDGALVGEAATTARLGVWSWQGGILPGEESRAGGEELFRQTIRNDPTSRLVLLPVGENPTGEPVSAWCGGSPVSLFRRRNRLARRAVDLALTRLRTLALGIEGDPDREFSGTTQALESPPDFWEMSRAWFCFIGRYGQRAWRRLRYRDEQWYLAFSPGGLSSLVPWQPPVGHYHADPCLVEAHGERHLFFEDFCRREGKGVIAHTRLDSSGRPGRVQTVLAADHHLSHPFVFEWQGEFWMVPESVGCRQVVLYRAAPFPDRWEVARVLLDGVLAADAVLHPWEGRWGMFATVGEEPDALNEALHLYEADTPLGPWHPHPGNPVKLDVRSSRPAGRLWVQDGQLIRPAQDCGPTYGHAITLCRVERWTREAYVERVIGRIEPDWWPGLVGTHTLEQVGGWLVMDGKQWRPKVAGAWRG